MTRLAVENVILRGGRIWLPNFQVVNELVEEFRESIEEEYVIEFTSNPLDNPLYAATEKVEALLKLCPDEITNKTQVKYLHAFSDTPFIVLVRRDVPKQKKLKRHARDVTDLEEFSDDSTKSLTNLVYKVCNTENKHCTGIPSSPIYGELTKHSMEKVINTCKRLNMINDSTYAFDVGAGIGKPSWHLIAHKVALSVGIDCEHLRVGCSYKASWEILKKCTQIEDLDCDSLKVGLAYVDIMNIHTLGYFDFIYMLDLGFPPCVLKHIAKLIGSGRCQYLISFHKPKKLIACGFKIKLLYKQSGLALHGGNATRTAYFYKINVPLELVNDHPELDPALVRVVRLASCDYHTKLSMYHRYASSFFQL